MGINTTEHWDDSTFNDACQPSLQKRYTLLLLMFHLVFLAHFEKRGKFSTVYFPDSNQVQQTFPYLHRVDIALSIFTNNQNYHHAQTPPFKATLPNQCRCLSDGGLDDKRPSHQMCRLGTNWWNHWLQGLLFWEWTCIIHASFSTSAAATTIDDSVSPLDSTKLDNDTGHNCKMPKALCKASCHHMLGLPPNSLASHQTELAFRILIIQDLDAMMFY